MGAQRAPPRASCPGAHLRDVRDGQPRARRAVEGPPCPHHSQARGGPLQGGHGGALGYGLDVKNLFVMNVEFCTGVDERLELPVVLPPVLDRVDLTGAEVLIADDVADTGKTLELVRDFCAGYVANVRTAVIYEKPRTSVRCDSVWRRTDRWIDFPWSAEPPVRRAG